WRESHDDAGMVPANECPRACARVGGGRNGVCVTQFFYFGLDFRRARQRAKANRDAQGNVRRTSSFRERTRPLDETRRMDPPASTNPQKSSRSLRAARPVKGNSRQI